MFTNRKGRRQTVRNVERRFKTTIRRANVRLAELDVETISEKATPHSQRHLYAGLRAAVGDDPVLSRSSSAHEDASFTFRAYAKAVKRRSRLSGRHLAEFDRALAWAEMGRAADPVPVPRVGSRFDLGQNDALAFPHPVRRLC